MATRVAAAIDSSSGSSSVRDDVMATVSDG